MSQQSLPEMPRPIDPPARREDRTIVGHVVYSMYVLAFFTGFTALVGVVVAYLNREAVRGTWLESHMTWQVRTFWYELAIQMIGWVTIIILVGWVILGLGALWFVWRIAKGWVRLANRQPVENPQSFL